MFNLKLRQEILDTLHTATKSLFRLFSRKSSIDLTNLPANSIKKKLYYNTITTNNFGVSLSEQDHLNNLTTSYFKLTQNDQYSIIHKLSTFIIEIYKNLDQKTYLPKLQHLQFVFDLMETNMNIFNLISMPNRINGWQALERIFLFS